jgi:hypothetical protein
LTNGNDVTDLDTESGRAVDSDVLVALLVCSKNKYETGISFPNSLLTFLILLSSSHIILSFFYHLKSDPFVSESRGKEVEPAGRTRRDETVRKFKLTPRVLGDKVEVFTTDDNGAGHLGRDDLSGEDTTTDRDETGEGALLVDVGTLDGFTRGLEPKTDLLVPTAVLSSNLARGGGDLCVVEQRLLLEGLLNLFGHDLYNRFV